MPAVDELTTEYRFYSDAYGSFDVTIPAFSSLSGLKLVSGTYNEQERSDGTILCSMQVKTSADTTWRQKVSRFFNGAKNKSVRTTCRVYERDAADSAPRWSPISWGRITAVNHPITTRFNTGHFIIEYLRDPWFESSVSRAIWPNISYSPPFDMYDAISMPTYPPSGCAVEMLPHDPQARVWNTIIQPSVTRDAGISQIWLGLRENDNINPDAVDEFHPIINFNRRSELYPASVSWRGAYETFTPSVNRGDGHDYTYSKAQELYFDKSNQMHKYFYKMMENWSDELNNTATNGSGQAPLATAARKSLVGRYHLLMRLTT